MATLEHMQFNTIHKCKGGEKMLKEKNLYKEGLPIRVVTADVEDYPIHYHNDLEIIYTLEGALNLKNGYYSYTLHQGDMFIVNGKEMHSLCGNGQPNMVMMLQLDIKYFSQYYENLGGSYFVTDMEDDREENLSVLKTILARIMLEILQKGYGYEQKVIESCHNLLSCLLSDFQYYISDDGRYIKDEKTKGNKILAGRLNRITDYMYENYYRKLTLNEIAENEQLSIYYLSHVIKEATGLSFQELLSFIRASESEKLLLSTNKKISNIAEETGFSAVRYYVKHFEIWYGMHPLEFRRKYINCNVENRHTQNYSKYTMSSPDKIEAAIRSMLTGAETEYASGKEIIHMVVDVDLKSKLQLDEVKFPEDIFCRDNMKTLARPFALMRSLKEKIVACETNYIITTCENILGQVESISILVYNISEEIVEKFREAVTKENILEVVKSYGEEMEMLIRCSGLFGDYKISRYTMAQNSIVTTYEDSLKNQSSLGKRQAIENNWKSLPKIEFSEVTVSETLNVRVSLKGMSSVLLLIDRI